MSNRFGGSSSEWFIGPRTDAYVRWPKTLPTVTFWSGTPEDLGRIMYDDLRALDDPDTPIDSVKGLADGTLPEFDQPDESVTRMWASTDGGVTGTWITTTSLPSKAQGALAETAIQPDGAGKLPESAVPERLTEAGLSETIGTEVATEGTPARDALNAAFAPTPADGTTPGFGALVDNAGSITYDRAANPGRISSLPRPFKILAPQAASGYRYTIVGKDPVVGSVFAVRETGSADNLVLSDNIYETFDGEATYRPKGQDGASIPDGYSIYYPRPRFVVVRHGDFLYMPFVNDTTGLTEIFKATPSNLANRWYPVTSTGLVMQSGATPYPQCIASDGTTLMVGEYGDPVDESGNPAPKIYKSTDGTTWTTCWTGSSPTRHVHAVAPDPYVPGSWWATIGDGGNVHIIHSTDSGATWTTVAAGTDYECVQISFSPKWVWFATDQDNASVLVLNRDDNTIYHAAAGQHETLAVPGAKGARDLFFDGATTTGSTTLTSATAMFSSLDLDVPVKGQGIPAGTRVASVTDAQTAVLTNAATADSTAAIFAVLRPGDRFMSKAWWGTCDPATESYYGVAFGSSTDGSNTQCLFYLPYVGGPLILVDVIDPDGADHGDRVWLVTTTAGFSGVRYGTKRLVNLVADKLPALPTPRTLP